MYGLIVVHYNVNILTCSFCSRLFIDVICNNWKSMDRNFNFEMAEDFYGGEAD